MNYPDSLQIGQLQLHAVEGSDTIQCTHCGHETGAAGSAYECQVGEGLTLRISGPGPGAPMWCPSLSYGGIARDKRGRADGFSHSGLPGGTPLHAVRKLIRSLQESASDAERDATNLRHMHTMLAAQVPTEEKK